MLLETIQLDPTLYSGKTLWAAFRDYAGNVWNGAALVAYSAAAMVAGAVAGAEQGSTSLYTFAVPAALATAYNVTVYQQIGGTPAATDTPVGSGSAIANALTGPSAVTLTFTDAGGSPVQNVQFTVIGQGVGPLSNAAGQASFGLPNGTYTIAAAPENLTLFATTTLVVAGTTSATIAGTAIVIPAATLPNQVAGYIYTRNPDGSVKPAVAITFKMTRGPYGEESNNYSAAANTITSDATGLVTANFIQGASYTYSAAGGQAVPFTAPTTNVTFKLPNSVQ